MTTPEVPTSAAWIALGTQFALERLDETDFAAPSGLPEWTNGHIAAHLARNADAVLRLLHWARTGDETLMYASADARAAEIERDAHRPVDVQLADVRGTAAAVDAAIADFPADRWDAEVRSARGRVIAAGEVPWMRVKEVWLHAVDLGAPAEGIPDDVAAALLADVAAALAGRDDPPSLRLVESGSGRSTDLGAREHEVGGTNAALLAWLCGRSDGAGLRHAQPLPELPAWL